MIKNDYYKYLLFFTIIIILFYIINTYLLTNKEHFLDINSSLSKDLKQLNTTIRNTKIGLKSLKQNNNDLKITDFDENIPFKVLSRPHGGKDDGFTIKSITLIDNKNEKITVDAKFNFLKGRESTVTTSIPRPEENNFAIFYVKLNLNGKEWRNVAWTYAWLNNVQILNNHEKKGNQKTYSYNNAVNEIYIKEQKNIIKSKKTLFNEKYIIKFNLILNNIFHYVYRPLILKTIRDSNDYLKNVETLEKEFNNFIINNLSNIKKYINDDN